jgi:hypothetical protein
MTASRRLLLYGTFLVAVLITASAAGAWIGPTPENVEAEAPAPIGQGVVTAEQRYRLVPETTTLAPAGGTFRFLIEGRNGRPVRSFRRVHEKLLHLVVVNRELTEFHHVHPVFGTDGTWSIDLPPMPPGSYRAIADFWVDEGPRLALGVDLSVAGTYRPQVLPGPSLRVAADGYEVSVHTVADDRGSVDIALTVRRDGAVVTDLEPYLGASGHLIGIHAGDLAYAHVHPNDYEDGTVTFEAELPREGRYGMYFDFKHHGVVHTASFTFDQGRVSGNTTMEHS